MEKIIGRIKANPKETIFLVCLILLFIVGM